MFFTWLQVASQESGSRPKFQDSHQKHLMKKWKLMGTLSSLQYDQVYIYKCIQAGMSWAHTRLRQLAWTTWLYGSSEMLYGGSASLYAGSALSTVIYNSNTGVPLAPSEAEPLSWARLTESEIQIHKSFLVILSGLHCLLLGPRGHFLQCRIFWIFPSLTQNIPPLVCFF